MSPEEKVRREHWDILQRLKEEAYRGRMGATIQYWIKTGAPATRNQIRALEKLEELGAIKILNPGGTPEYV